MMQQTVLGALRLLVKIVCHNVGCKHMLSSITEQVGE